MSVTLGHRGSCDSPSAEFCGRALYISCRPWAAATLSDASGKASALLQAGQMLWNCSAKLMVSPFCSTPSTWNGGYDTNTTKEAHKRTCNQLPRTAIGSRRSSASKSRLSCCQPDQSTQPTCGRQCAYIQHKAQATASLCSRLVRCCCKHGHFTDAPSIDVTKPVQQEHGLCCHSEQHCWAGDQRSDCYRQAFGMVPASIRYNLSPWSRPIRTPFQIQTMPD